MKLTWSAGLHDLLRTLSVRGGIGGNNDVELQLLAVLGTNSVVACLSNDVVENLLRGFRIEVQVLLFVLSW